jgi:hypothetical protein
MTKIKQQHTFGRKYNSSVICLVVCLLVLLILPIPSDSHTIITDEVNNNKNEQHANNSNNNSNENRNLRGVLAGFLDNPLVSKEFF